MAQLFYKVKNFLTICIATRNFTPHNFNIFIKNINFLFFMTRITEIADVIKKSVQKLILYINSYRYYITTFNVQCANNWLTDTPSNTFA